MLHINQMPTGEAEAALAFSGREANHEDLNFRLWNASRHAQYFTPTACAKQLHGTLTALLDASAKYVVALDPTCGNGRLLHPWKAAEAQVFGIELDDMVYERAKHVLGRAAVRHGDILDYAPYTAGRFNLVLTNPPYGLRMALTGKDLELETRPEYGDTIESQTACLEVAIRALHFGGLLVAILPTTTWTNEKDQRIKQYLYKTCQVWARITVEKMFYPEYGITPVVDIVLAQKQGRHSDGWPPYEASVDFMEDGALARVLGEFLSHTERVKRIRSHFSSIGYGRAVADEIPTLDRLRALDGDPPVRITRRGLQAGLAGQSLMDFLNGTFEDFNPIQGTQTGIVEAHASLPAMIRHGVRAAEQLLGAIGFQVTVDAAAEARIRQLTKKFTRWSIPLYPPKAHQLLAYFEDRKYPALERVSDPEGRVLFEKGRLYHLRPTWTRHVSEISREFVEAGENSHTKITSVDRGYLTIAVYTEQGRREFKESERADVETIIRAFGLPEVKDIDACYPELVAHWRRVLEARFPYLKDYQHEDLARALCKPFLGNFYTMGGGKTLSSTIFALARGYRRILVICQSSHVTHWIGELRDKFGIRNVYSLVTHEAVSKLAEKKRAKMKPDDAEIYVTSYQFLSLDTRRVYRSWECIKYNAQGHVTHSETNTTRQCRKCNVPFRDAILRCPKCETGPDPERGWTGEFCRACGYAGYTYSRYQNPRPSYFGRAEVPPDNFAQYPAYKRLRKLFSCILVDEAQQAKSSTSACGQATHALKAKGRVLATGTIMKGYVTDTYTNLAWLLGYDNPLFPFSPGPKGKHHFLAQFGTFKFVSREFADTLSRGSKHMIPAVSNLNRFGRLMAGFSIRRTEEDLPPLPPRHDISVLLEMDEAQQALYARLESRYKDEMDKALHSRTMTDKAKLAVISRCLWQLRFAATIPVSKHLDEPIAVERWNKLDKVLELVRQIKEGGEKVLIFSGLQEMVNAVAAALARDRIEHLAITARVSSQKRFRLVEEFSRNGAVAMVAGLNVMNRGFNIQAANHVILTDFDWNPESMEQAQARARRQGQTKETYTYHLIGKGTVDENLLDVALQKQEAIAQAMDGKAYYQDTAEYLNKVASQSSVLMRLAREVISGKAKFRHRDLLKTEMPLGRGSLKEPSTRDSLSELAAHGPDGRAPVRKPARPAEQLVLFR